jgi:hypothetical protein
VSTILPLCLAACCSVSDAMSSAAVSAAASSVASHCKEYTDNSSILTDDGAPGALDGIGTRLEMARQCPHLPRSGHRNTHHCHAARRRSDDLPQQHTHAGQVGHRLRHEKRPSRRQQPLNRSRLCHGVLRLLVLHLLQRHHSRVTLIMSTGAAHECNQIRGGCKPRGSPGYFAPNTMPAGARAAGAAAPQHCARGA